jgi:hypothetical protein
MSDDDETLDRIADALFRIASSPKTTAAAYKKQRQAERKEAAAEQKTAALTAQAEQTAAALTEREAELAAREAAIERREAEFAASARDVRDELYAHHNRVEQAHSQLVRRVMATAGILGEWNFQLQDPPSWDVLKKLVALPDDPPAPSTEVSSAETVRHDWAGSEFIPDTTLTRTVRGAA